ncbi:MAG: bifunctional 4-hydroxy-2-oxoglutarate aldolase/2-dehydro-3-deoxy-phosphogluconate aldolase [Candidatus Omnitrophica bacterium]|nr:bifunctional 4-hydroxy-2-oxoglutarate aldolase/2-dehydro-3-deoxy-phosphogluconate aldolase [Candidatus Omnitrophota bacterium]MDD5436417.1 bifunctional 4-hydroxy-2-oxoglutarate aldolase/2-dehydro-3-deoxy-phosphogluconate aldolase [Candidatus Omnitrophota bacterium]
MDIARFKKLPIMGILRGIGEDSVEPVLEAAFSAGVETLEITMNTENAERLISRAVKVNTHRLMIGAGTVLNVESLRTALDAGASFIVMPAIIDEVIDYCVENVIPVFPGALTPGEIYHAWTSGATMVKVFPSGFFGPAYFKEIKGPFANIELMACGGVKAENITDYFANGASAVSFGAGIFRKEWLANGEFEKMAGEMRKLVEAFRRTGGR